ncbi:MULTISPECIES: heavy metal sensor histidine kinase [Caldimonas]|uniref:heavy metal sensor histidine kinase n=1 Tax=Caldimonas TaxID=196013 RepID=UPI00037BDBBD|nr:heavy metal sensor histidine kinase [Caldimonas manganoxidans]GIX25459.1 MAG: two-component sensor histidine kinase [Caldimonas sp.]
MRLRLTLTARLTLLYTLVSLTMLLGLGVFVLRATDAHFVELDEELLRDKSRLIARIVAESRSADELASHLDHLLSTHEGLHAELHDGTRAVYDAHGLQLAQAVERQQGVRPPAQWTVAGRTLRVLQFSLPAAQALAADGMLVLTLGLDIGHHQHFMQSLTRWLTVCLAAATLLSGLLAWWVARRGLAPLREMKARAQRVTARQIDHRMPEQDVPVELADLAQGLNSMLDRLQQDVERLSQFCGDLAHELRTPISNLLTQTQVALAQPRPAQAYREILASNAEELQRLARMVSDMLFLAQADHGLALPRPERIVLAEEVKALFDFYEALAEDKGLRLEAAGQAEVWGDRLMVRRAISNLLSNALRHARPGTPVRVSLEERDAQCVLTVHNEGPDIDPQDLPRLFDRFFRADRSRRHGVSEGAGLGLAITQAVMRAHGGYASARSGQGQTAMSLHFPRAASG